MSIIPIEVAMQHVYADEADQPQVERKLASAIETAEQFMGRRVYATTDDLAAAKVLATANLPSVVRTSIDPTLDEYTAQIVREANETAKYELMMALRGIVLNPAIEIGILLILGDLYKNRENTVDGSITELPIGAKFHLQPFRFMGV